MLVAPQYSHIQKQDVTTYAVSNADNGALRCSLQQAIDKAEPFSRIVVASGKYYESISISTPLEIVGESSDSPVITWRGTVLTVASDVTCYFENICWYNKTNAASHGAKVSVAVTLGTPTFHRCRMSSMYVSGSATPVVSSCIIEGSLGHGLTVSGEASGEYTNNTIFNHRQYCIAITTRGAPVFRSNMVYQEPSFRHRASQGGALLISQGGGTRATSFVAPLFVGNSFGDEVNEVDSRSSTFERVNQLAQGSPVGTFFDDPYADRIVVKVEALCNPVMEGNVVTGGGVGLYLCAGASGTYTKNEISHSQFYGLYAAPAARCQITQNSIFLCATGMFSPSFGGIMSGNTLRDNFGCGLLFLLSPSDTAFIHGNTFTQNDIGIVIAPSTMMQSRRAPAYRGEVAELVYDAVLESKPELDVSTISHAVVVQNRTCGIFVMKENYDVTLQECAIGPNDACGVLCTNGCAPRIVGTHFDHGSTGLVAERTAAPKVSACQFSNHSRSGALIRDRGRGMLHGCKFDRFAWAGVMIDDGGDPLVVECTFSGATGSAIVAMHGAIGELRRNTIAGVATGFAVSSYADPLVEENTVTDAQEMGCHVFDEGIGTFLGNLWQGCRIGIVVASGGDPTMRRNTIRGCGAMGIVAADGSRGIFEKNVILESGIGNVLLEGRDSCSYFCGNDIAQSYGYGVLSQGARGKVRRNTLSKNREGGLCSADGSTTTFEYNICTAECGPGMRIAARSRALYANNLVHDGSSCGCKLEEGSQADVVRCEFRFNAEGAIYACGGAGGDVSDCTVENNPIGLILSSDADVKTQFQNILFTRNVTGLHARRSSIGKLDSCKFSGNNKGLLFTEAGACFVMNCLIVNNGIGACFEENGVAVLRSCELRENNDGVLFERAGSGRILDCRIVACVVGVRSTSLGAGEVLRTVVVECTQAGVLHQALGATTINQCEITGNVVGFHGEDESTPKLISNRIEHNEKNNAQLDRRCVPHIEQTHFSNSRHCGLLITCESGVITRNFICNNAEHGVVFVELPPPSASLTTKDTRESKRKEARKSLHTDEVKGHADASLQCIDNVISGNKQCGVYFRPYSVGRLLSNTVTQNAKGIVVDCGATPEIARNTVSENNDGGIIVEEEGSPLIHQNKISQNRPANIILRARCRGSIDSNDVASGWDGVHIHEGASTQLSGNSFTFHNGFALAIFAGAPHLAVLRNRFSDNDHGIVAFAGATGHILCNIFTRQRISGLTMQTYSAITVSKCEFIECVEGAVMQAEAGGSFCDCVFSNCSGGILICGGPSGTNFTRNVFESNTRGVRVTTTSPFFITKCIFKSNVEAGISLDAGTCCKVYENNFFGGRAIQMTSGTESSIENNTFSHCLFGILLFSDTGGSILSNVFEHNDFGIHCSGCCRTNVQYNLFLRNRTAAVACISSWAESFQVSRCLFTQHDVGAALLLSDGGGACITDCDFHQNVVAVRCSRFGRGVISRCQLHNNDVACVADGEGIETLITGCLFFSNTTADIDVRKAAELQVTQCLFRHSSGITILGGSGTYTSNTFRDCAQAFIIDEAIKSHISSNSISGGNAGVILRGTPSTGTVFTKNYLCGISIGVHAQEGGGLECFFNLLSGCDVGCQLEYNSALFFHNNGVVKSNKHAIHIRGSGNYVFTSNALVEGVSSGILVYMPPAKQSSVSHSILIEKNLVSQFRTNIHLYGGDLTLRQNYVFNGEVGISIAAESRATLEGNVVFENARLGMTVASSHCTLRQNLCYTTNAAGALDHRDGITIPRDNTAYNQSPPRVPIPPPSAPLALSDLSMGTKMRDVAAQVRPALREVFASGKLPVRDECVCPETAQAEVKATKRRSTVRPVRPSMSLTSRPSVSARVSLPAVTVPVKPRGQRNSVRSVR